MTAKKIWAEVILLLNQTPEWHHDQVSIAIDKYANRIPVNADEQDKIRQDPSFHEAVIAKYTQRDHQFVEYVINKRMMLSGSGLQNIGKDLGFSFFDGCELGVWLIDDDLLEVYKAFHS